MRKANLKRVLVVLLVEPGLLHVPGYHLSELVLNLMRQAGLLLLLLHDWAMKMTMKIMMKQADFNSFLSCTTQAILSAHDRQSGWMQYR